MCARQNSTDSRDRAIARLAAEELRSRVSGAQDCPDAALIAAYSERSLADDERQQLETHFAVCERCQQTLAALGTALDAAPLKIPETSPPLAITPAGSPRRWMWWLTPAFSAAAAALLWMVLRPTPPQPVEIAADYARTAPAQQQAAPRNEAQNQNKVASTPRAEKDSANAPASLASTEAIAPPPSPAALDKTASADSEAKSASDTLSASAQAAPSAVAPGTLAATSSVPENQSPARQEQAFSAARAAAPVAVPQAAAAQSALSGRINSAASPQPVMRYAFSSPTGGVMWRLGDAGSIEKSSDRGKTWQIQVSGVTADLIAGSSSSDQVAWVIGRNSIILRTTDGQSWTRIPPPPGVTAQWSVIAAHDAMNATLFTNDFRRFVTADGGQNWSLEP